jgi:tRNA dimethylallyltransferase
VGSIPTSGTKCDKEAIVLLSHHMNSEDLAVRIPIILVAGPTASGKSKEAVRIAKERNGEVISVDSRQVYRGLDIGTEKTTPEEMEGVPHHLIDIREPSESYSAGDFVHDAKRLIQEIADRGRVPILAGGTHFYFDALLFGLPEIPQDTLLRDELEKLPSEELLTEIKDRDPERFAQLDPANKRRLVRAVEIIRTRGRVPARRVESTEYKPEWVIINPSREILRERIDARLEKALANGLIEEVERTRALVGDERLNELGLEYKTIGEYLRDERSRESLQDALSSKLWHYARRQKAWLRKLKSASEE